MCRKALEKMHLLRGIPLVERLQHRRPFQEVRICYISSFLGFTPADEPEIIGICLIHDPTGIYYGGTIAAPVIRDIYENILPYLGLKVDKKAKALYYYRKNCGCLSQSQTEINTSVGCCSDSKKNLLSLC